MDCSSRDDGAVAGDDTGCAGGGAHPRKVAAGERAGAAVRGWAAVWAAGVSWARANGGIRGGWAGAVDRGPGGVCGAVSVTQALPPGAIALSAIAPRVPRPLRR